LRSRDKLGLGLEEDKQVKNKRELSEWGVMGDRETGKLSYPHLKQPSQGKGLFQTNPLNKTVKPGKSHNFFSSGAGPKKGEGVVRASGAEFGIRNEVQKGPTKKPTQA